MPQQMTLGANPSPLLPCKFGVCNLCIFMRRACNEFGGCFASPARSLLHHCGLARPVHPLVTSLTVGKGLWEASCLKEHTHRSWVFHFPRPNPEASSSEEARGQPQHLEWGWFPAVNLKLMEPNCFHLQPQNRPSSGLVPVYGAGQRPASSPFFPLSLV